jgi:hypothetical protein
MFLGAYLSHKNYMRQCHPPVRGSPYPLLLILDNAPACYAAPIVHRLDGALPYTPVTFPALTALSL